MQQQQKTQKPILFYDMNQNNKKPSEKKDNYRVI